MILAIATSSPIIAGDIWTLLVIITVSFIVNFGFSFLLGIITGLFCARMLPNLSYLRGGMIGLVLPCLSVIGGCAWLLQNNDLFIGGAGFLLSAASSLGLTAAICVTVDRMTGRNRPQESP